MPIQIQFAPNLNGGVPFRFLATFDGKPYNLTVTWLMAGQRWYLNCYDASQNHIFTLPLIGSPSSLQLSSLVSTDTGLVTAVSASPHGLEIGNVYQLQLIGNVPTTYNGSFECAIQDSVTFTYQIPNTTVNPGAVTTIGWFKQMINLLGGYFQTNSMEWWPDGNAFVIYP